MSFDISFQCAKQLYSCLSELKTNASVSATHIVIGKDAMNICEVLSNANFYMKIRYHRKYAVKYEYVLPEPASLNLNEGQWLPDRDRRFMSKHYLLDYKEETITICVQTEKFLKTLHAAPDNECFRLCFNGAKGSKELRVDKFSQQQSLRSSPWESKIWILELTEDADSIELNAVIYESKADKADYTLMLDSPNVLCAPIKSLKDLSESTLTYNALISITTGHTADEEGRPMAFIEFDLEGGLTITKATHTIFQRENNGDPHNAQIKRRRTKQSHMIAEQCPNLPGSAKQPPPKLKQKFDVKLLQLAVNILEKTCGRTTLVMKNDTPLVIRGVIGSDIASVMFTILFHEEPSEAVENAAETAVAMEEDAVVDAEEVPVAVAEEVVVAEEVAVAPLAVENIES